MIILGLKPLNGKYRRNITDLSERSVCNRPPLYQSSRATHCNPKWLHFLSAYMCSTWRVKKTNINILSYFSFIQPICQITRKFLWMLIIIDYHRIVTLYISVKYHTCSCGISEIRYQVRNIILFTFNWWYIKTCNTPQIMICFR